MPGPSSVEAETSFERRIVSVLFADLVGFTSLSERLDPEDVATVQDAYFSTVRETIARHGGQLEKFIGDAAMAVFGVPRARDDDAERAIRAGLALIGSVELLGVRLGLEAADAADAADAGLRLRVGVNTGEVVSAESGEDRGRVTGDPVNLAARLQAAAEPGTVLIGPLTALAVADAVELESVGELTLKGKAEPIAAWRVAGLRPERSREQALGALRAPLLGRDAELAQLDEALRGVAASREARQLLIVAPPGVGKSRLLLEFATRADAAGALVLRARARADVIGPADPVGQLLLAALRRSGAATREAAPGALREALTATGTADARAHVVIDEVTTTLWPTADDAGAAPAPSSDVAQQREARFGAWLEALDALTGDQPSVWLVEDVHWAGGDLLAFLARAGSDPSRTGRLVVATARPSVLEQSPQATSVLQLPPLPALDSAQLVTALIGDALPDDLVREVAERSDGNPLFIEELLRSWISGGTLVPAADDDAGAGWQLAVAPGEVPLPATVQAIYAAQLDDLPGAARLVARRASVAGRRFPTGALAPLDVPDPAAGLDQLRRRAFLRGPEPDAAGDEVYAYRHALLRDAGYASLSRAERGRLHMALAAWLEQTAGADVGRVAEPIASHYEAALAALPGVGVEADVREGLTDATRLWLERAAEAALGVAAHEAAVGLLARAVALARPDSLEAARLRLRRGELLAGAGDLAVGIEDLQAALGAYRSAFRSATDMETRSVSRAGYANSAAELGFAWIEQIRMIKARDLAAEVLAELSPPEDALAGRLHALHAVARVGQGDREGTLTEADRAFALVRESGNPRLEIEARVWRAKVRAEHEIHDVEEWRELERVALEHGEWAVAATARLNQAAVLESMRVISARGVLELQGSAIELAQTYGLTESLGWARYVRTDGLLHVGDWDEAVQTGRQVIEVGERNAYLRMTFRSWMALMPILSARGDAAFMERYRSWWHANREAFPDPPSAYGQVHLAATDQMFQRVGLPAVSSMVVTPETLSADAYSNADWLLAVEAVIVGWVGTGDVATAADVVPRIRASWFKPQDSLPPERLASASMSLIEAWVSRAQRATDRAEEHTRRALHAAREADAPWWVVRAIRALPEGEASGEELAEGDAIERRLRVRPGAAAPPA